MLGPITMGAGRQGSPFRLSTESLRTTTESSGGRIQENLNSLSNVFEEKNASAPDLEQAIEANKELSLAYQIMRAITRLEKGEKDSLFGIKSLNELSVELDYSFSLIQLDNQNFRLGDAITTGFSVIQESFDLSITMAFSEELNGFRFDFTLERVLSQFSFSSRQEEPKQVDPLILNLDGNDFSFDLSYETEFDLDADGQLDRFHSLSSGNYFLALDNNENGVIDDGLELFGDAGGAVDGFSALSEYDSNDDQTINAEDEIYQRLMLLSFGRDGVQRLRSIADEGIANISLKAIESSKTYQDQNRLISESEFKKADGNIGRVGDFLITAR